MLCKTANGTAIAGKDYTAVSTTLTWASGDSADKNCSIAISDSVPFQGKKTFSVELSSSTGAALSASTKTTVTILGNYGAGAVSIAAPAYTVEQNAGKASVVVNRAGGSAGTAIVYYASASKTALAGTDFTSTSGSLTWADGDASAKTVSIPVSDSKPFNGTKSFAFALANAENAVMGSTSSSMITISGAGTASNPTPPASAKGGFFVSGGKLYDPNGAEFRIRGVDRCHYDSDSQPGISNSGANAVRMFMYGLSVGAPKYASILQTQHIDYKEVAIPSMPVFPDGTATTGNTNANELAAGVAWWVANAATFTALDRYLIINIANEWGPSNSTVWRDSYISAVAKMRAAGYHGTLMIDAGGWGQDVADLLNYSTAVFDGDPERNLIFSLHIYGSIPTASVAGDLAKLKALSASAGMAFVVGEFGPGRNIGPSPTMTTPRGCDQCRGSERHRLDCLGVG